MFFVVLVFGVLAFGSQVVLSLDFKFKLSQVEQCEPVSITLMGDPNVKAIPMSLTLVPFGSHPISIPIPNAAANTSGVYVTFFPFAEGTTFIASLDDSTGENVAKVSDIIRVLPSPTGNTSCLPSQNDTTTIQRFTLNETLSQCEDFELTYDRTVISRAPSVRLYHPRGSSFLLNQTADDPEAGTAEYLLNFSRGKQVVLMFDDGLNHRETSSLMTVEGDSLSSDECLNKSNNEDKKGDSSSTAESSSGVSYKVIIGSAAGGGAIVLIALIMLIFILRERRRRTPVGINFNPARLEKGESRNTADHQRLPSPTFNEKQASFGFVRDPPYTAEKFLSPTAPNHPRASMASWSQATPDDQRFPISKNGSDAFGNPKADDRLSLSSLDIEGILNLATIQSNRSSRQTTEPTPLGPVLHSPVNNSPSPGSQLSVPRPYPARGHLRDPSDIPADPTSIALSSVSANPFADNNDVTRAPATRPMNGRQMSLDSVLKLPPGAVIGLPSSPRNGPRFSRERVSGIEGMNPFVPKPSNRSTTGSMGDWYGVAR